MKKLAVFVEGQTEQVFVVKLVKEIAGRKNVAIKTVRARGGSVRNPRKFVTIQASSATGQEQYYVLIVDCGTDNRVASDIRDEYNSLSKTYSGIVGIRDVYAGSDAKGNFKDWDDVPRILQWMRYGMKTKPIEVDLVLAVMEIESWFLSDASHYEKIDTGLTKTHIEAHIGFFPPDIDTENIFHPAALLDAIYRIVGKRYGKNKATVQDTVSHLDYADMYFDRQSNPASQNVLLGCLDRFFDQ